MRLITAALAAFVLAIVSASANGGPPAGKPAYVDHSWYVSGNFGWNVDGASTIPFVDEESGLVGTAAVGAYIDGVPGLRAEFEASFRTHDTNIGPVLTAEHDTTALMANVAYTFQNMGRWEPYLLVGAGAAWTDLTFGGLAPLTVENSGFAYQAGAGIDYRLTDNVKAGVRYVYFEGPEVELFGFELDGGSNHAVTAGVTVEFN